MKTHDLLRTALALAGQERHFRASGPQPGLVFPDGAFLRNLRARADAPAAQLRIAASDLGVARVELTLELPAGDDALAVAVYEQVDFLWATGYPCHFSRVPGDTRLQLKAHTFIGAADDASPDIHTVADAGELAAWLRTSVAACRHVLAACARCR